MRFLSVVCVMVLTTSGTCSMPAQQTNSSKEMRTSTESMITVTIEPSSGKDGLTSTVPASAENSKNHTEPSFELTSSLQTEDPGPPVIVITPKYDMCKDYSIDTKFRFCQCYGICPAKNLTAELIEKSRKTHAAQEARRYHANIGEYAAMLVIYGITWILGVSGNIFVLITTTVLMTRSATNTFLGSLATADLLLIIFCLPVKATEYILRKWAAGQVMCILIYYIRDVTYITSIFTLVFIGYERYFAICHPMKAQYLSTVGRAKRACIGIWVLACILAIPRIFIMELVDRVTYEVCVENAERHWQQVFYCFMVSILFIIPLIAMIFFYVRTSLELWRSAGRAKTMTSGSKVTSKDDGKNNSKDESQGRIKVIKMLAIVVIIFVVCWGPTLTMAILDKFRVVYGMDKVRAQVFFQTLSYCNSCINPIIYAFMSRGFLKILTKCLGRGSRDYDASSFTASTRMSRSRASRYSHSVSSIPTISGSQQSVSTNPSTAATQASPS